MNFTPVKVNMTERDFVTVVSRNMTVMILSITILSVNAAMVYTFNRHHICTTQIFKLNPRYILFINLVLNDMIQLTIGTSLYIFAQALPALHVPFCIIIIFIACLVTINTPLILAFMAAECYISVCFPLRYSDICTLKRTYVVVGIIWTMSSFSILPDIFVLLATEQQQFLISRVFCEADSLLRSSYSLRNIFYILFLVLVWFTLFYTFFRILFVAKAVQEQATKARNTLLLHGFQMLLCMMVFVHPFLTQYLSYLIPGELKSIQVTTHIIIQMLPRFLNPVVYGLRDKTLRKYMKRYCICVQLKVSQR